MTPLRRPFAMARVVLIAVVVALLGGSATADVLKVGDRLAELDVAVSASGKPFRLKAYRKKWVVVTVGAEWCKPCAKELPTWDKLAGELKGKVTFIAVGIDDEVKAAKRFHKKLKLKNMTLVYLPASKSAVVASYGSDTMPTTFIGDPHGVVRLVRKGFETGDINGEYRKLKAELTKLVK